MSPRVPLLLVFLLAVPPLLAADADLGVSIHVVGAAFRPLPTRLDIVVTNHGPSAATNVTMTSREAMDFRLDARCQRLSGNPQFRCTVPSLDPGASTTFAAATGIFSSIDPIVIPVEVHASENDPDLRNNSDTVSIDLIDQASVAVTLTPPASLDDDNAGTMRVTIANRSPYDMADAHLQLFTEHVARIVRIDPQMSCTSGSMTDCILPAIPAGTTREIAIDLQFTTETTVGLTAEVRWGTEAFFDSKTVTYYETFDVTHARDDGPGSLRQAILDANAGCGDVERACRIAFTDDAMAIAPVTALPAITARWITIDGRGVVNLDGAIVGAITGAGDGLVISGLRAGISGLAIRNFAGSGILIRPQVPAGSYTIAKCDIEANERGVVSTSGDVHLTDNILSGNRRSGAFLTLYALDASGNQFSNNGGSGIYIAPRSHAYGRAMIANNVIENNAGFGVALALESAVIVTKNRIVHNGIAAIDIGLDGPSLDLAPNLSALPATPVIESVRFDGAATIVEGITRGTEGPSIMYAQPQSVDFYASAEAGDAESFLGTARVGADRRFSFRIERDLRGQWIAGVTLQRTLYFGGEITEDATSELSRAVIVEPSS